MQYIYFIHSNFFSYQILIFNFLILSFSYYCFKQIFFFSHDIFTNIFLVLILYFIFYVSIILPSSRGSQGNIFRFKPLFQPYFLAIFTVTNFILPNFSQIGFSLIFTIQYLFILFLHIFIKTDFY